MAFYLSMALIGLWAGVMAFRTWWYAHHPRVPYGTDEQWGR